MATSDQSDDKTLLARARARFQACEEREADNRQRAREAIRFAAGDQWPQAIKQERENPHQEGGAQPCPVLDKTQQFVRQVVNEERLNTPRLKFRPVDDVADPEVAQVYDGLARHIQDRSAAVTAYTTAGEHAARHGFGYFRLLTEYCDPQSFDQDIRIGRIHNSFMVYLGPHTDPTGSDAKYGFVFEDMDLDDFKAAYPKQLPRSFDDGPKDAQGWFTDKTVRVAEYIEIIEERSQIVLLDGGQVMPKDEYDKQARAAQAVGVPVPPVLRERESVQPRVRWYKLTCDAVLERQDMLGTMLPIFQVVGDELVLPDGEVRRTGMVSPAMDAQRLHNYSSACFIENVALAPRAPWLGYAGQIAGFEQLWKKANRKNVVFLPVNPVLAENGELLSLPQRQPMPGIPSGWQQMLLNSEHAIEASLGMYGASVGGPSRERSGVALEEQKQQGQLGNLHYPDNLARAIHQMGRVLLEWLPQVYDTARVARIIGQDDEPSAVQLNPEQEQPVMPILDQFGKDTGKKTYNLGAGKYDVTVSSGPNLMTQREEASKLALELSRADPSLMQKAGDKIFRLFDVPGMEDIAERLKLFLPPEVQQSEGQDKERQDPRVAAAMVQVQHSAQQLQQQAMQLQQAKQEVDAAAQQVEAEQAKLEATRQQLAADARVAKAEFEKREAQFELHVTQLALGHGTNLQAQPQEHRDG